MLRLRPAVWPLGVGFVAQTIGALLVFFRVFASGFTALWITIAALVVAVLVVVGVSVSRQVRARQLERKLLQGLSDAPSVDEQQLARLRQDMAEALDLLRRAGRGRDAIYTMPWLLVVGRPQAILDDRPPSEVEPVPALRAGFAPPRRGFLARLFGSR